MELEPGVIDTVALSRYSASSSARETTCVHRTKPRARETTGPRATTQGLSTDSDESPCNAAAFV